MRKVVDWRIIVSGSVYTPPECRRFHLQGILQGVAAGEPDHMTSSAIVAYDEETVTTRSGSVYRLVGKPCVELSPTMTDVQVYASMAEAIEAEPYVALS